MKRWIMAGAACAALAGAAAGCGSSGDSSSGSSGASADAGLKGTPVKLGVVSPGPGSPGVVAPDAAAGARDAALALNKRGGLDGHPVEVVYCNDKGDPNQTATCARELVNDKVVAVVGGQLLNGNVLTPVLAKAGIPQIGLSGVQGIEFTSPNVYPLGCGGLCNAWVLTAWSVKAGKPTSMVSSDVEAAVALRKGLENIAKQAGGKFTSVVLLSPTQTDLAPIVAAAKRNGAKNVLLHVNQTQSSQFIESGEAAGGGLAYLSTKPYDAGDASAKQVGGVDPLNHVVSASSFPPLNYDNPTMARFRAELAAGDKAGVKYSKISDMQLTGFQTWLAVQTIEKLVKQGGIGDLTSASLTKALNGITTPLDFDGVIPPWNPNTKGPTGIPRISNPSAWLVGYKDGKPYTLADKPLTVAQVLAGAL
jgi:ABC-type branched-subunit amino acid transport system substrate-binding protein